MLLENDAKINMKSNDGSTPLSIAIGKMKKGNLEN